MAKVFMALEVLPSRIQSTVSAWIRRNFPSESFRLWVNTVLTHYSSQYRVFTIHKLWYSLSYMRLFRWFVEWNRLSTKTNKYEISSGLRRAQFENTRTIWEDWKFPPYCRLWTWICENIWFRRPRNCSDSGEIRRGRWTYLEVIVKNVNICVV